MKDSLGFSALLMGVGCTTLLISGSLAQAAERPIRWNTGGAVWSTHQEAMDTFLSTGEITDRGLQDGLNRSGWTAEQIRQGMNKPYAVNFMSVANFLYSDAGVRFLDNQTRSYFPYWTLKQDAVVALRSAIMSDAVDGVISSAGIMAALPVDFRLADNDMFDGKQNVCDTSRTTNERQSTSLFSWYVFLPACIQSSQVSVANPVLMNPSRINPSPQPVKGLW